MDDRDPAALLVAAAAAGDEYAWHEMVDRYAAAPGPAAVLRPDQPGRSSAREMGGVMPHRWDDDQHLLDDLGDAVRGAAGQARSRSWPGGLQLANRRGGPAARLPRF